MRGFCVIASHAALSMFISNGLAKCHPGAANYQYPFLSMKAVRCFDAFEDMTLSEFHTFMHL